MNRTHRIAAAGKRLPVWLLLLGALLAAWPRMGIAQTGVERQRRVETQTGAEGEALACWRAGTRISEEGIRRFGCDRCFEATEVSDHVFRRIRGKSYKPECTIPVGELRYLKVLHRNLAGEILLGELICHRTIADDLLSIFRQLFEAGYPIERMVLIDDYDADDEASMAANNSSAFNFRFIAGTRTLSRHSSGLAVDINPLYNPFVRNAGGRTVVEPACAERYACRELDFPYRIDPDDLCVRLFREHGFEWGGTWKTRKDYQHFEKRPAGR